MEGVHEWKIVLVLFALSWVVEGASLTSVQKDLPPQNRHNELIIIWYNMKIQLAFTSIKEAYRLCVALWDVVFCVLFKWTISNVGQYPAVYQGHIPTWCEFCDSLKLHVFCQRYTVCPLSVQPLVLSQIV